MDYETLTNQSKHNAAIESEEMNLIALLRPRVFLDGNKWCVLYGENIMDGVAGFGDSPILAVYDFNKAWHAGLDEGRKQGKGNEHCRAEPQPVAWQFQDRDGKRHGFVDEQHRQNTIADGSWPMRALYAAPPSVPDRDAYEGAREDLLDWKRRAQRAEATLRGLGYKGIDASEAPSAPVGVEDKARAMFEAQADKLTAPWDRQWEPTKGFWRKRAAEALAQQPAACPKCDGTGEADSGGIYPWGAPATIPCDCQQPAAVDARIEAALKLLHPHLDTGDSRSAPVWAIEIYAALVGATLAAQPGGSDNDR